MKEQLQLFTARYSNPNVAPSRLAAVGITRYPPRFRLPYELKANLYDLAPTPEMLQIAKGEDGRERFIVAYLTRLNRIGADEIVRQLRGMQGDVSGIVLLCYEDVTTGEHWCHRLLLGEWLREHAGLMVTELPDPGKKAARKKPTPDRRGQ
jgi:hypothetical protein